MDGSSHEEDSASSKKRPRKLSPTTDPPATPGFFGEPGGSERQAMAFAPSRDTSLVVQETHQHKEAAKPHPKPDRKTVISGISAGSSLAGLCSLSSPVVPTASTSGMTFEISDGGSSSTETATSLEGFEQMGDGTTAGGSGHTGNVEPSLQGRDLPNGEGMKKLWRFLACWREGHGILRKTRHRLRTGLTGPAPRGSAPQPSTSPEEVAGVPHFQSAPSHLEPTYYPAPDLPSAEAALALSVEAFMRLPGTQKSSVAGETERAASDQGQPTASTEQKETSPKPLDPAFDDAVFKRPFPVPAIPSTSRGSSTSPSTSSLRRSPRKRARPEETIVPNPISTDPTMEKLFSFSALVHREHPSVFQRTESALYSILNINYIIRKGGGRELDPLCTHRFLNDCWLLEYEGPLNELLVLHNLEIVQLPIGTYTLRRLGRDMAPEDSLNRKVDPRREAIVMWLLRVHRCISRLSLDLTAVTESPSSFCGTFSLHRNYRSIEIGVSGLVAPPCQQLSFFLGQVRELVELSLFGIYVASEGDGARICTLLASNDGIVRLQLRLCRMPVRHLAEIINAATWLRSLGELVLTAEKSEYDSNEEPGLKTLLNRTDLCDQQKLRLNIDTSYQAFFEHLASNQYVTELEITHKIVMAPDLIPLLENTGLESALKRLVLCLDMQSVLKDKSYEAVLQTFIAGAALDMLKLHNTVFTEKGIRAIADGLKNNGKLDVPEGTSHASAEDSTHCEKRKFLKELHLRGDNLSCDELSVLSGALQENKDLKVLDVGLISATERTTHRVVTKTIVETVTGTLLDKAACGEKSPTAPFRLVKHHFPEELVSLIAALRRDITFRKLSLVFSLSSDEDRNTRLKEFGHLLAILPYYGTLGTLESIYIESNSCGIPDQGALGLSLLAFMSKTLVEVTVTLGDCCSEFTSIILFEGLADSVSIRSLTMSGWCLNSPAQLFFEHACKRNRSLQRLRIHMSDVDDEGNAAFVAHLPDAIKYSYSLVEFHLTHGTERRQLVLHKVQAVLRQNEKMLGDATKLVVAVGRTLELQESGGENYYAEYVDRLRCVMFHHAKDTPQLRGWLMALTGWSIAKIEAVLEITRDIVAGHFSSPEPQWCLKTNVEAANFGGMDDDTQNVLENLRIGDVTLHALPSLYDERYLQRLEDLNRAIRDIYYEEQERYAMQDKNLKDALACIA